jgi:hypothetical protein
MKIALINAKLNLIFYMVHLNKDSISPNGFRFQIKLTIKDNQNYFLKTINECNRSTITT